MTLCDRLSHGGAERLAAEISMRLDPKRFSSTLCISRLTDPAAVFSADLPRQLQAEIEDALAAATVTSWLARLEAADLPCGPINDVAAVLAHPQVRARNMVVRLDDDRLTGLEMAGNPIKNSLHVDPPTRGRVPDLER